MQSLLNQFTLLCRLLFCLAIVVWFTGPAHGESQEPSPEENLKEGRFRLAVFNQSETGLLTATDTIAQLWDLETGALVQQFEGHDAPIRSICFSPDEKQILTGSGNTGEHGAWDSSVWLWDVTTGEAVAVLSALGEDRLATSLTGAVLSACFSPDGQRVLSSSWNQRGVPDAALLWNLETQEIDLVIKPIAVSSARIMNLPPIRFSPDGKWVIGLRNNGTQLNVWNSKTGEVFWQFGTPNRPWSREEEKRDLKEEEIAFWLPSFSPSGKYVVAASTDRMIRLWDAQTGMEMHILDGHTDDIRAVLFSSDEKHLFSASADSTIRRWDIDSGKQLQQWDFTGPVYELSVSSEGSYFVAASAEAVANTVAVSNLVNRYRVFGEIRDIETGESIRKWELPPMWRSKLKPMNAYSIPLMSPSGRTILSAIWEDDKVSVVLIDTATGTVRKRLE